ncbi:hypothetical protein [Streptomyces sp. NPDC004629]|uniref:hypothetical protein n=1 Tax=Streptomyces sp. NPDC004629 TaxID=3364705 RepID=UPI0036B8A41F
MDDGFVPETQARSYGFHSAPSAADDTAYLPADDDVLRVLNGWSQTGKGAETVSKEEKIFNKIPIAEYGCSGEAQKKLSRGASRPVAGQSPGGEADALNYVLTLRKQAGNQVRSDPRFKSITARWASCYVKATGTYVSSPLLLARDPRWTSRNRATTAEVRAAVSSNRCQLRINYLGVTDSLTAAYEQRLADSHSSQLRAISAFLRARLRNATVAIEQERTIPTPTHNG